MQSDEIRINNFLRKLRWTPLDSYIFRNFILSLLGSLIFFVVIYEIVQLFNEMRYLPKEFDGWKLFLFHLFDGVYWAGIFQPFSFLFAVVFVLSRMAQLRELVAIVSSGVSVFRVTCYIILFTIIYYLFITFYLQNRVIFPLYQQRWIIWQKVFNQHKTDRDIEMLKDNENFSIFGNNNLLYIVGRYHSVTKELENITIVKFQSISTNSKINPTESVKNEDIEWLLTNIDKVLLEKGLTHSEGIKVGLRIDADRAIWDSNEKKWRFDHGVLRIVEEAGEKFSIQFFTNKTFDFVNDPPYYFEKIWYPIDAMTYSEAKRYVEKLKNTRQDYKGVESAYYAKFTYALGIIFVVLMGIGVVDMSKRKISFIINLMISMIIFVIYYIFYAIGISFSTKGDISPILGATMGTILLGILSIVFFLRVKT